MKFECKVVIHLPLTEVIEAFMCADNLSEWQDDFISITHLQGATGQVGSTARLKYKRAELLETITLNDLPHALHGTYEGSWGKNTMENYFSEEKGHTTWIAKIEYLEMNGLIMKMMKLVMPGIFKKQTQKFMENFKAFIQV